MPTIDIILELTPAECLHHYNGSAQWIQARSTDGRLVEFPARALSRVVTPAGVSGVYRLAFSEAGRFESIRRVR